MRRALAAHVDLITALKNEAIQADVAKGRVTMFVPPEGGVALRMQKPDPVDTSEEPTVVAPPAISETDLSDTPTDATFDGGATFVLEGDD